MKVRGVNSCGELWSWSPSLPISVNQPPTVFATADVDTVCFGEAVILNGSGGATTYTWSDNVEDGLAFVPNETSTYIVTGSDGICSDTASQHIVVNPLPEADAGADIDACFGNQVTLNASGGVSYDWEGGVLNGSPFIAISSNEYVVHVTDVNNCVASDTTTVSVHQLPEAIAGDDQFICEGESVVLNASGGTSYNWDQVVENGVPFTPSETLTYTVTVEDENDCADTDELTVVVYDLPLAQAGQDLVICEGDSVFPMAAGGVQYIWTYGVVNGQWFFPTGTNTYVVTVTDNNNCSATDDWSVTVNQTPATPVIYEIGGELVSSSISGNQWFVNSAPITNATNQTHIPLEVGSYYSIVTENGCPSDTSNVIVVILVGISDYSGNSQVTVSPNPFEDKTMLKIISNENNSSELRLFDVNGRLVLTDQLKISGGTSLFEIGGELGLGIYVLEILNSDDTLQRFRIVKTQ